MSASFHCMGPVRSDTYVTKGAYSLKVWGRQPDKLGLAAALTTATRTRGGPCATSNAKPDDGRHIHVVRKRSGRFQLVSSPLLEW